MRIVRHRSARAFLVLAGLAIAVAVLSASGLADSIWLELRQLAQTVHDRYGINIPLALILFGVGEAVFCASVVMMLHELGQKASWRSVRRFDFKHLELGSRRMMFWLWVNRLSWIVPWLVVIGMSVSKVPWWATLLALAEVGSTFLLGLAVTYGFKLPWWNTANAEEA